MCFDVPDALSNFACGDNKNFDEPLQILNELLLVRDERSQLDPLQVHLPLKSARRSNPTVIVAAS